MGKKIDNRVKSEDCATVITQPIYSAEELARIYNTSRPDFIGIDLEVATRGWNSDFIFEFLYNIDGTDSVDLAVEWIEESWRTKHHCYETYSIAKDPKLTEERERFFKRLQDIKEMVKCRIKSERKKENLIERMLESYHDNKSLSLDSPEEANPEKVVQVEIANVHTPNVKDTQDNEEPFRVLLDDLPENIRCTVVVPQAVFDAYVKQLNEDTWSIVEGNKGKYCDPLRFLSNYHGITSRNTSRETFDQLLHYIVKKEKNTPSFQSSMGRCQLTSSQKIGRSYLCYECADVNPKLKKEIWSLIRDCSPLEESLQPVWDIMKG